MYLLANVTRSTASCSANQKTVTDIHELVEGAMRIWHKLVIIIISLVYFSYLFDPLAVQAADNEIQGFVTFEDGVDNAVIQSSIPGLRFSNTNGYDWTYGDWRTGHYNGKYPNGAYMSNGNFFAWLGPRQGDGRIDFTEGGATYLSIWVSAGEPVTLTGYYANGEIADIARLDRANVNTGQLANLIVRAQDHNKLVYAVISGIGNYWLIDDLSTDADGVPNTRNPVIFVPGVAGSHLENDPDDDGSYDEVWPNIAELIKPGDDRFLHVLRLDEEGLNPLEASRSYTSVRVGDIIRTAWGKDVYYSTVDYFTNHGYSENETFFVCPYDWRKDVLEIASGLLNKTLDQCVSNALAANPDASKVNILAHSMGGMVARAYIFDKANAEKVERLVTLGTPYLGAPKVALGILHELCFLEQYFYCLTNPRTVHDLLVNFPSAYQLAPGYGYFQVYPNGYLRRDYDGDGDGQVDGWLNEQLSHTLLARQNSRLAWYARNYHWNLDGWKRDDANGVQVFMMVGDRHGTPALITERRQSTWLKPSEVNTTYQYEKIRNGDGTVPIRSADMRYLPGGIDLSGNALIFYFDLTHEDLPLDNSVLQFAIDIFTAPSAETARRNAMSLVSSNASGQAYPEQDEQNGIFKGNLRAFRPVSSPRTEPLPLEGHLFQFDASSRIEIRDEAGKLLVHPQATDAGQNEIPNADYLPFNGGAMIFLRNDQQYEVRLLGHEVGSTDMKIQSVVDEIVVQTVRYDDLPLTPSSVASLAFDPSAAASGFFILDQNGDSIPDGIFEPSRILNQTESQDTIAPKSFISVQGEADGQGNYLGEVRIIITATDGLDGTGVAKIEYSTDQGVTVKHYESPFLVNTASTHSIIAKATDLTGNEEAPLTVVRLRKDVIPGDCNSDQTVGAADLTALALEFFDGDDNNNPNDTPNGAYPGTPACDANEDGRIGASDLTCIALIFFNGPGACQVGQSAVAHSQPTLVIPDDLVAEAGGQVTVPIVLQGNGAEVSSLLFSIDYDERWLTIDPADHDEDGVPDAIVFNLPDHFVRSVTIDLNDASGELDIMIASFASPAHVLPEGELLSITFGLGNSADTTEATIAFAQQPEPSLGDRSGHAISGSAQDGAVRIVATGESGSASVLHLPMISR